MKKLLAMFAVLALAACSSTGDNGGLWGGADCDTPEARDFLANADARAYFAYDSSVLSADARRALDTQAEWLKKNPNVNAIVQGHADERGTREYNLALGERRASASKRYLVSKGIASGRITTISYGKERPEFLGSDEASWAKNRKTFTVVKAK